MIDPDTGRSDYDYTVFGELLKRWDANHTKASYPSSPVVTFAYDQLGRTTSRVEAEGTTTFSFYTSTDQKLGLLSSASSPGFSESFLYDNFRRPTTVSTAIGGGTAHAVDYAYYSTGTAKGKLQRITYPVTTGTNRLKVDYEYDAGFVYKAKNGDSPYSPYYELNSVDALGRERLAKLGTYLFEERTYDRANGFLKTIKTGPNGSPTSIQNLSYTDTSGNLGWDDLGNLTWRRDINQSVSEEFTYDSINRLLSAKRNGSTTVSLTYDTYGLGNIATKSDVGTYTYGATCTGVAKPHAVTSIAGPPRSGTYSYDCKGNMTSRNGKTITWYTYGLPNQINYGTSDYDQFSYGPDRSKFKQVAVTGGSTVTTEYVGRIFEKETVSGSGVTTYRHNIYANGNVVAIYTKPSTGTDTTRYVHRDHQNSVVALTNESGVLQDCYSYDAFGKRRNCNWTADTGDTLFSAAQMTERGYTGHEHLDSVRLINMNGRVQDPIIGRFLSPDPFVQAPRASQSLNRYSYVWNSPLSLFDPSGFQTACVLENHRLDNCDPYWNEHLNDYERDDEDSRSGAGGADRPGSDRRLPRATTGGWWQNAKNALGKAVDYVFGTGEERLQQVITICPQCDLDQPLTENQREVIQQTIDLTAGTIGAIGTGDAAVVLETPVATGVRRVGDAMRNVSEQISKERLIQLCNGALACAPNQEIMKVPDAFHRTPAGEYVELEQKMDNIRRALETAEAEGRAPKIQLPER